MAALMLALAPRFVVSDLNRQIKECSDRCNWTKQFTDAFYFTQRHLSYLKFQHPIVECDH